MKAVRIIDGTDGVDVVFLESARFYRVFGKNPAFDSLVAKLRDAIEKDIAVEVRTASITSGVIEDINPTQ